MAMYYQWLSRSGIQMESIFKWFFGDYLFNELKADGFTFNAPSDGTTDLEKCKLLATELDSVLKQYTMYVNDGCIDRELLQMSSNPVKFDIIPSFLQTKYIYPNGNDSANYMHLLFSDQSDLAYTEKTKSEYDNFFKIVESGIINIVDFLEYQAPTINWLCEKGCIVIDDSGFISLTLEKAYILWDLHNNQVSCLHYLNRHSNTLDLMLNSDEIIYESSLFSKPEQSYMNYILNKAEFSNGYDLRNKYIHGTHSLSPDAHANDYIELLKIMVLIIIKINEEFCIRDEQKTEE